MQAANKESDLSTACRTMQQNTGVKLLPHVSCEFRWGKKSFLVRTRLFESPVRQLDLSNELSGHNTVLAKKLKGTTRGEAAKTKTSTGL